MMLAQVAGEADAVLPGQADVEQHEREFLPLQRPAKRRAVGHADGLEPLASQVVHQEVPLGRFVFDHEYRRLAGHVPCDTGTVGPGASRCSIAAVGFITW